MEGEHPVGDGGGVLALVGGDDDGAVALAEAGEQLDHLAGGFDVHVGEGLVEQKKLGDGEQDAGERGALAHALRVLAEGAVEIGVEADLAQGFGGRKAGAAGIEAGEVAEILLGGELVVEHGRVAHVADAGAGVMGLESCRRHCDRAEAGAEQSGENAEQSGFAGAVFADENVAAAGLEIDGDLAKRGKGAEELGDAVKTGAERECAPASAAEGGHSQAAGLAAVGQRAAAARIRGRAAGMAGAADSAPAGAYLLAHLAWRTEAWKTPSRPYEPSARACESSLKVSGGGSEPL